MDMQKRVEIALGNLMMGQIQLAAQLEEATDRIAALTKAAEASGGQPDAVAGAAT